MSDNVTAPCVVFRIYCEMSANPWMILLLTLSFLGDFNDKLIVQDLKRMWMNEYLEAPDCLSFMKQDTRM